MHVCVREAPSLTASVFGNSDVQRDIGARVYDVLETQIGELDLSEEPPTTNGKTIARPYGPMGVPWVGRFWEVGDAEHGERGCMSRRAQSSLGRPESVLSCQFQLERPFAAPTATCCNGLGQIEGVER